jgi:Lon protease-like protein
VGYRLAEILPIPSLARQRLLELDDTLSRLEIIHQYLRQHNLLGA